MKSLYTCLAAALLTMLSVGCSSSKSNPAPTPDAGGSALAACKAYCTKSGSKCADAGAGYASTTECEQTECTAKLGTAPAACQTSATAYYNCLTAQTDICAMGCLTEMDKLKTDCPSN